MGDLTQTSNYLELNAVSAGEMLIELCKKYILDSTQRSKAVKRVQTAMNSTSKVLPLEELQAVMYKDEVSLRELTTLLSRPLNSSLRSRATVRLPSTSDQSSTTRKRVSSQYPKQIVSFTSSTIGFRS